ncbi:MAG: putative peptidoglycan glycosyltransferase FtsW [Alphaproteobacteria bacterium]|nr:putative peptidoglycan glycosyltransferase FtsW [Alphaproteobacteria bacterium]
MNYWAHRIFNALGDRYRSLDRGILYGAFLLMLFGVFLTFAASPAVADRNQWASFYFVKRHLFFLAPALGALFFTALLSVPNVRRLARALLIVSLVLMAAVLVFGADIKGARRWIVLFGITIQPSEFVKPAFAVVAAWWLASGRLINQSRGYWKAVALFAVVCGLLFCQPDIGMLLTIAAVFCVQLFLSGIPVVFAGALGGFFAGLLAGAYFFFDHVRVRVDRFLNPAREETYQVAKSMETLKNAGWFGKGPGEGVVKYELPDAHTDFIMAVSAEEFGFIVTALLVCVFIFIVLRGYALVCRENNYFSQIAVGGLLTQIAFQAIVNMGSTLNLLPTKGMTLPLISYGGSSLVSMGIAFGIILALTHGRSLSRGLE